MGTTCSRNPGYSNKGRKPFLMWSSAEIVAIGGIALLKLTLPTVVAAIVWRLLRHWREASRGALMRGLVRSLLGNLFHLWLAVEAYSYLRYLYQHHRLSEVDIQREPAEPECCRRELLERCLATLDEVTYGRSSPQIPSTFGNVPRLSKVARPGAAPPASRTSAGRPTHKGNAMKRTQSALADAKAVTADTLLERVSSDVGRSMATVEDLMRWSSREEDAGSMEDEVIHLSFKRSVLSSWFFCAPVRHVNYGNICEWLAEYFFRGMLVESIRKEPALAADLHALALRVMEWAHLTSDITQVANPNVRCMRLTRDPLPSTHRPFWMYVVTHLLLPWLTRAKLVARGFCRCRSGTMTYWLRRGACRSEHDLLSGGTREKDARSSPIIFCHGLGVGMLPYIEFITRLCEAHASSDVFCVDLPHVQMRPHEDVPSAREMCACLRDMLHAWGHTSAHFVGHSFGTIICAWGVRQAPELVLSASFIDPICFLLYKSDLMYNALYGWRKLGLLRDPQTWLLSFLIFTELYVCHTLSRNFFWQQNNLWPEDLAQIPALLVLSGEDRLVPTHSVRGLFHAVVERHRLAKEAERSGGDVVIQSGLSLAAACGWSAQTGSPPRRGTSPPPPDMDAGGVWDHTAADIPADGTNAVPEPELRLCFFPDAAHGQVCVDPPLMEMVLQEVDHFLLPSFESSSATRKVMRVG